MLVYKSTNLHGMYKQRHAMQIYRKVIVCKVDLSLTTQAKAMPIRPKAMPRLHVEISDCMETTLHVFFVCNPQMT